jgi:hypothetical protein
MWGGPNREWALGWPLLPHFLIKVKHWPACSVGSLGLGRPACCVTPGSQLSQLWNGLSLQEPACQAEDHWGNWGNCGQTFSRPHLATFSSHAKHVGLGVT